MELTATAPPFGQRTAGFGVSVFAEISRLAQLHGAVNLGQGFPDFDGPEFVKQAALDAIAAGHNQYCRTFGIPELTRAVADHEARFWGTPYDPETEVTITSGATEAIFTTLQAILDPGDEVVLFEPFYDSYRASVLLAGGVPKVVTLHDPDFAFDPAALAAAIGPRTRAILVNTPHNPTGKIWSRAELETVAELCRRHDLIAISDEVYEHLVFTGKHVPLGSLPGMRERTIKISSAGKTFSFTGWKIGWTLAPPPLTAAIRAVHQFVTFCHATPFQYAIAKALGADDAFFTGFLADYRARRDKICRGLAEVGFGVREPGGTYFVLADLRPLGYDDDVAFCRMLPEKYGVAAIPPTAFYEHTSHGKHLVRFAFCKTDQVLDEGLRRLRSLAKGGP